MYTLEAYKQYYYDTGKLPLPQINYSAKPLNEKQLSTKYIDYCKKVQKTMDKGDTVELSEHAQSVATAMEKARALDPTFRYWNYFYSTLTPEQQKAYKDSSWLNKQTKDGFDVAHIFDRGSYPYLADNINNMVMLPRCVHSYIDRFLNPFSMEHEHLTKEQHDAFWIKLVGSERYLSLQREIHNKINNY